jgi:hypothetical protein
MGDGGDQDGTDLLGPQTAIAFPAAATLMSMTLSSGAAQRRVSIPDRSRIHSSLESIFSTISALVTIRDGR